MALFNYFNRNAKVPSINIEKIETEIKNGEDVTRPNHIRSISPVAASQLVLRAASNSTPARTRVWPRELPLKSESL